MPFKSKAQQRLFFAKESHGELPRETAHRWASETPNIRRLPNRKHKRKPAARSHQRKENRR